MILLIIFVGLIKIQINDEAKLKIFIVNWIPLVKHNGREIMTWNQ